MNETQKSAMPGRRLRHSTLLKAKPISANCTAPLT